MWSNNNNCSICRLFDWFPCMYHCTKQGSRRQQTLLGRGVESHTELYASLTWRHRLTLWCSNVVKFVRREIGEIVRYLPHKKFRLPLKCRYYADRAQNLPEPAPNIWLTLFQISSQSVHFRQSYSRTREHRFFAPYSIYKDRIMF